MTPLRVLFLAIFLFGLALAESAEAQLLEDINKLKTERRARRPFIRSKKNISKPQKTGKKPDVEKVFPVPFSKENAGEFRKIRIAPKFTKKNAGEYHFRTRAPRITRENAGEFRGRRVAPRFTKHIAGRYRNMTVIPKTTQDQAGQGYEKWRANPRYSIRDKSSYKVVNVRPTASYADRSAAGRKAGFLPNFQLIGQKNAKYKPGKESDAIGPKVPATYNPSHSVAEHNKTLASYQKYLSRSRKKSPHHEQTNYLARMKKMHKVKDAHPSANYLSAKYDGSALIREVKRKTSVTWVRIFGNKTQPDGVIKNNKKAKFDKEEKNIWNNEEREYTR